MKVSELQREMKELFAEVHERFAQVDAQFVQVDARFAQVDARFAQVDARFVQVDARFESLQQEMHLRFAVVEQRIREEGDITRRHFDVVAEQFRTEVRLTLDRSMATADEVAILTALNATDHAGFVRVIDDHETRLRTVEQLPKS